MSFLVSFVTFLCKSNSIYFCSSCNYRVCCTVIITFFNFYQCLKTNFHAFLFSFQDNRCKLKLYKLKLLELSYHIRLENHHGMNCYLWGSRHGAVVRVLSSHQCVPGSIPGPSVMWVEFVVGSLLCSMPRISPHLKNQHFQISVLAWKVPN